MPCLNRLADTLTHHAAQLERRNRALRHKLRQLQQLYHQQEQQQQRYQHALRHLAAQKALPE